MIHILFTAAFVAAVADVLTLPTPPLFMAGPTPFDWNPYNKITPPSAAATVGTTAKELDLEAYSLLMARRDRIADIIDPDCHLYWRQRCIDLPAPPPPLPRHLKPSAAVIAGTFAKVPLPKPRPHIPQPKHKKPVNIPDGDCG